MKLPSKRRRSSFGALALIVAVATLICTVTPLSAQSPTSGSQSPTSGSQSQVPAAGGPQGDVGPYSIPTKKKEEPPPVRQQKPKNPPEIGDLTITKDVPLVNLDVMVTTKEGIFVPNLKKDNFKIFEDGVQQQVSNFNVSEAPITAVLLVEFASTVGPFVYDALNASYSFAQQLKKDDWIAVVSYDMKPQIIQDFTQDKRAVYEALGTLRIPTFRETNLFDALYDSIDRLEGVDGHKYIILVSSGCDSFSKLTYDKILKRVQGSKDITIFAVGTGQALREWADSRGSMAGLPCSGDMLAPGNIVRSEFLQADNQMNTFAKMTGGRAFFPRFQAEFPEIFHDIGASIRNQYTISYHPSNTKMDGTYRKLKVEVIDPRDGKPLKVVDQKGKEHKYSVIAREGYTAKHVVD